MHFRRNTPLIIILKTLLNKTNRFPASSIQTWSDSSQNEVKLWKLPELKLMWNETEVWRLTNTGSEADVNSSDVRILNEPIRTHEQTDVHHLLLLIIINGLTSVWVRWSLIIQRHLLTRPCYWTPHKPDEDLWQTTNKHSLSCCFGLLPSL